MKNATDTPAATAAAVAGAKSFTVGSYLATRLAQIGLHHHFVVAGDYNLLLLDQLLLEPSMEQVYCSNELNCGFSAEGYARANGAAAAVVTFSVGAISAFNGLAGAYAENLPVILIAGSPNTNDRATDHILHHTLGIPDLTYTMEMAKRITCAAVSITSAADAPAQIDHAIGTALRLRKPAYIEIACNLPAMPCAALGPVSALLAIPASDAEVQEAAVAAAVKFLEGKNKPMLLIGSKLRSAMAEGEAVLLAEALGCAVAVMAAAKSFFPEDHPQYVGTSWGQISSPGTQALVDWSDGILCLGCVFNDYSTVGWTAMPTGERVLTLEPDAVQMPGCAFNQLPLSSFLRALAGRVARNDRTMVEWQRIKPPAPQEPVADENDPLVRAEVVRQLRPLITGTTTLFAETGDSWFNGVSLGLPRGARFEVEMQWGHIGWSIPASFGYAVAAAGRRVITLVGDGSFQLTAQEVAQMVRRKLPVLIVLMNNRGYTIEVEIHDGPYNNVKNWDYAGLMQVFNAGEGSGLGLRATTGKQLGEALKAALANDDGPTLIECNLDRDDCSPDLISFGRLVAKANGRAPGA